MNAGYGYDIRTELVCENGTLTMAPPITTQFRRSGMQVFPFAQDWRPRFSAAYHLQMQAWIDSIERRTPVGASAWDGLVGTAVAEAGVQASETGAAVRITLPATRAFIVDAVRCAGLPRDLSKHYVEALI